jgi:hypothetical protein
MGDPSKAEREIRNFNDPDNSLYGRGRESL